MDSKIRAVGKITQVEELRRDQIGARLESMRNQNEHLAKQLLALSELKTLNHSGSNQTNSMGLMNLNLVDQMLQKMLNHQKHEQAVMEAQCQSVQKQLQQKAARVHGLEQVLDRWSKKQNYEKAKREQKLIEDIINSRIKRRAL
ncbi:flagellar export protein FliJ [Vibrio mediterranei]|jgi:flagellar export protein FliJ|uniref:Flagellar FliJ protein n=1 Tax=Vibrio barjaei TaxID=1676683 RepID=A0ABW7IE98_9VIBR|nr:flagellar export protein FliJ [Vibrio barjaei]MCG9790305.1 flagellar export protein FliJ [Vibrio mediterranei]OIN25285.1 flagellar export protein FliJ [Vibrio barjaei]